MKEESVSLSDIQAPQPRALTEEQRINRDEARARMRVNGLRDKEPTSVFGLVATPANPYLCLLRDLMQKKISLEEFDLAIDAKVISDHSVLSKFEYKPMPTMPPRLADAYEEMKLKAKNHAPAKRDAIHAEFEQVARENGFASYFESRDRVQAENASNLYHLSQMLLRNQNNAVYASRLTSAISTHQGV